ncbi:GNAT family N-acetyltransferase [Microbulbifer sp. SAOS-129_SWC]|uniref:GNAT family N-acetyltransferase n=1 Tax=Microbulbifer sp. SAOS-129_SWC TaxID=3145235 RepID=UPI003217F55D
MSVEIRPADWAREREQIRSVRDAVFVREQQVDPKIEWDDCEARAQHFLVLRDGTAVGTGRLLPSGKIGRMAILQCERGTGLGLRLLAQICDFARQRGDKEVYLHAQCHAEDFYHKAGFSTAGGVFSEADIPHVKMVRALG